MSAMSMSTPMGSPGKGMLSVSVWPLLGMPNLLIGTPMLSSLDVRFFCMCCCAAAIIAFMSIDCGFGFLWGFGGGAGVGSGGGVTSC